MLTVKHIEVTGHENLYPATRVSYQPRMRPDGQAANKGEDGGGYSAPCIFIDTPKGDTVPLGSWGAFYVMNDTGKTIAKYDLGGWDHPKEPVTITGGTATWTAPGKIRVG